MSLSASSSSSDHCRFISSTEKSGRNSFREGLQGHTLLKRFSEPTMLTFEDMMGIECDPGNNSESLEIPFYRRSETRTDFQTVHGMPSGEAPDLLQLFNIFQFNKPEKPSARMLINVTLTGSIHPVRLLITHDASVQDIIKASLKAYVKEGRLSRQCIKNNDFGLHYSPFCLESMYSCKGRISSG
ncbi:hypothetical protein KP509_09G004800 [Ceratopteris richardii]|uniref:DUF7054 domain-containing protein n=1 Tax=Ceratopteris richardii TaxID=49495 RepID=A0A8T2TXM7_CERRI|nr:hypothetical protein KP509_09G004800 [Ceratopteris richardii]